MAAGTELLEKHKTNVKKPSMYKVLMHNDDYTPMDFVVDILMDIFNKNEADANKIMLDVHHKGKGIAGVYTYDIALTKMVSARETAEKEGYPLMFSMEGE